MATLTAEEITARERAKLLLKAVKERADNGIRLEKAFEEIGCTCHPARGRMEAMQKQRDAEVIEQLVSTLAEQFANRKGEYYDSVVTNPSSSYNGTNTVYTRLIENHPLTAQITELYTEITKTDRAEHPALDAAARAARPFLSLFLMEHEELIGATSEKIAEAYAAAWMHDGWRPTPTTTK